MGFELDGIDHIHIYVSDRTESEKWYAAVFGLFRTEHLECWATDGGPLTLQNRSGSIHLALFESSSIQNTTVAFKTSAAELLKCLEFLASKDIKLQPIDHRLAWSVYLRDPDGNPYEITTYEYEVFAAAFKANA